MEIQEKAILQKDDEVKTEYIVPTLANSLALHIYPIYITGCKRVQEVTGALKKRHSDVPRGQVSGKMSLKGCSGICQINKGSLAWFGPKEWHVQRYVGMQENSYLGNCG